MGAYDREDPEIADVLAAHSDALRNELHTAMPAVVKSYDRTNQTVNVSPVVGRYLPTDDGGVEFEHLPDLFDVPVKFQRSGKCGITFDLEAGDTVLLVFSQYPAHLWYGTGATGETGDLRTHDLGSACAIPGLYSHDKKTAQVGDGLVLFGDKVSIGAANASHPMALGDDVKQWANDLRTWLLSHEHPNGNTGAPTGPPSPPPVGQLLPAVPAIESARHKIDG